MEFNKEKIMIISQLCLFNIIFTTWDQYSDIKFAYILFVKGHSYWSLAVISPTILNFIFTTYSWYYFESKNQKKYSWIFLIFQLWPQICAVRIIISIVKNKADWKKDKALMDRSIGLLEPFLESIPQTIILTTLFYLTNCQKTSCKESNRLIIGNNGVMFGIAYASSIIGAGLGLATYLGTGPVKTLPKVFPNGPYFLTLITVLGTIITKGLLLVIITLHSATFFNSIYPPRSLSFVKNMNCSRVTVLEPLLFQYGRNDTSHGGYAFKSMDAINNSFDRCKDSNGLDIGVCGFYCGDLNINFHLLSVIAWLSLLILPQGILSVRHVDILFDNFLI